MLACFLKSRSFVLGLRCFAALVLSQSALALSAATPAPIEKTSPPSPAAPVFETHVRPILKAHCFHCHGEEDELQGGLDLRLVRLM